jgi:hypothetical protein
MNDYAFGETVEGKAASDVQRDLGLAPAMPPKGQHEIAFRVYADPVPCACEGFTERVGDLSILITRSLSLAGQTVFLDDILVHLNTAVTNRVDQDGMTDVSLVSDYGMLLARGSVSGNIVRFGKVRLQFSNVESETTLLIRAIAVNAAGFMPPGLISATVEIYI